MMMKRLLLCLSLLFCDTLIAFIIPDNIAKNEPSAYETQMSIKYVAVSTQMGVYKIPLFHHPKCNDQNPFIYHRRLCYINLDIYNDWIGADNITIGRKSSIIDLEDYYEIYGIGRSVIDVDTAHGGLRQYCSLIFAVDMINGKQQIRVGYINARDCANILDNGEKNTGSHLMRAITAISDQIGLDIYLEDESTASQVTYIEKKESWYKQFGFQCTIEDENELIQYYTQNGEPYFGKYDDIHHDNINNIWDRNTIGYYLSHPKMLQYLRKCSKKFGRTGYLMAIRTCLTDIDNSLKSLPIIPMLSAICTRKSQILYENED